MVADGTADPVRLAADLLIEAEHGTDSSVVLVTPDDALVAAVDAELSVQLAALPERRAEAARASLGPNGGAVVTADLDEAIDVANRFAPEHLQVAVAPAVEAAVVDGLVNAGEILVGQHTPFSAANFVIGCPASLPTSGFAHVSSGMTAQTFMKRTAVARADATRDRAPRPVGDRPRRPRGLPGPRRRPPPPPPTPRDLISTSKIVQMLHDFAPQNRRVTVGDHREPRLATVADAAEVGRLLHDFNAEFDTPSPGADVLAGRLRVLLEGAETFAILAGDPAVAVALVTLRPNVWYAGRVALLDELYVVPHLRGRGIGSSIIEMLLTEAVARGVELIEINVDEGDVDAQRFYERHGFSATEPATGERAFYYARELTADGP